MERLRCVQKQMLIENGLLGKYNAAITKLMLSVNHGMVERSAKDVSAKIDQEPISEIRRIILVNPEGDEVEAGLSPA